MTHALAAVTLGVPSRGGAVVLAVAHLGFELPSVAPASLTTTGLAKHVAPQVLSIAHSTASSSASCTPRALASIGVPS